MANKVTNWECLANIFLNNGNSLRRTLITDTEIEMDIAKKAVLKEKDVEVVMFYPTKIIETTYVCEKEVIFVIPRKDVKNQYAKGLEGHQI